MEEPALEERIVELLDERIEEVALEERTGVVVDRDTDGAVLREGLVVAEVRTVVFVERTGAAADVLVRVVALRVAVDVVALRVAAAVVVVAVRVAVAAEVARTLELPKVRFIVASRRIPVAD